MTNVLTVSRPPDTGSLDATRRALAAAIARRTPTDGRHPTAIPSLTLVRYSSDVTPGSGVLTAQLVVAAQGAKRVILAGQAYEYGHNHGLISALDLPLTAQVTAATPQTPYLCAIYALDLPRLAALLSDLRVPAPRTAPAATAISVCLLSTDLLDVLLRMVHLLDTPGDIPFLAPLLERELLYRLLTSEQGPRLRHLTLAESPSSKIAQAIAWLREHYAEPLRVEDLARHVHMSVSSLHHHFKASTTLSPLQYQKQLRLSTARRLLLTHDSDVTTAATAVGYSSLSQFSREYSRLFGLPPLKDAVRWRLSV
jgi:AraC-like DNA-binding protein